MNNTKTMTPVIDLTEGLEKENILKFITNYKMIVYLWAITAIFDAFSTSLFMMYTGPDEELNVLTRACCNFSGIYIGPYLAGFLKFSLALPFLVVIKKFGAWALNLSTLGQIYAVIINVNVYLSFSEYQHLLTL